MEQCSVAQCPQFALGGMTVSGEATRDSTIASLRCLEQLQRSLDAARSLLLTQLLTFGVDTGASVASALGVSVSTAHDRMNIAAVVDGLPSAPDLLASGAVGVDHLRSLRDLVISDQPDTEGAMVVLGRCVTERLSPNDTRKAVLAYSLSKDENTVSAKQRSLRSVTFFKAEHGCIGARVVLPSVEGHEFRNRLRQIVDDAYRAAHPERADTLGGHNVDPLHQRMADALVTLVRGEARSSSRPAIVATINLETLEADLIDHGPVPLIDVLGLAETADLFYAILTGNNAIMHFGRSRRYKSAMQQLAMIVRDRGCTETGCDRPASECQADHIRDWALGGRTDIDNLELRCDKHHRLKNGPSQARQQRDLRLARQQAQQRARNQANASVRECHSDRAKDTTSNGRASPRQSNAPPGGAEPNVSYPNATQSNVA